MWRANTDRPKKRTRQITEDGFDTVWMFYEIRKAGLEKKNRTQPDLSEMKRQTRGASEVPSQPRSREAVLCSLMCYFTKPL